MILPIYLYGQPALRKPTEEISPETESCVKEPADRFENAADTFVVSAFEDDLSVPLIPHPIITSRAVADSATALISL